MKTLLLLVLVVCPLFAQACSFARGYEHFTPSVATFEAKTDGDRYASLPAPQVKVVRIIRGTTGPSGMCGDVGQLTLELYWPKSSVYRLSDVGFYFRVVEGEQASEIFPVVPITGKIEGRRAIFFFVWLDGHPATQIPLKLDAEVFAVNKGLEIGPTRRFRISDGRGR